MNVLVMAYANKNFGDDLFVQELCRRYPRHTFFLYTSQSYSSCSFGDNLVIIPRSKVLHKIRNLVFHLTGIQLKSKLIRIAKKCEIAVYIGGSIFIESNTQEYWNKVLHERTRVSNTVEKYYICSANFGPYHTREFLEKNEEWLGKLTDVCFRDSYSYSLFKSIPNIRFAPDVAFTINAPKKERKKKVAISCMSKFRGVSYQEIQSYLDKLVIVSNHYCKKGYNVVLLVLCKNEGDEDAARYIMERVDDKDNIALESYCDNVQQIIDCIAESSLVIATRFHAMVVSLATQTPVFPIVYSKKTQHVIDDLKYDGDWCLLHEFESVDLQVIDSCMINPKYINTEVIKREAQQQFLMLDKELLV